MACRIAWGPEAAAACPPGLRAIVLDRIAAKGFAQAVDVSLIVPAGAEGCRGFRRGAQPGAHGLSGPRLGRGGGGFHRTRPTDAALLRDAACRAGPNLDRIALHRTSPPAPDWDGAAVALFQTVRWLSGCPEAGEVEPRRVARCYPSAGRLCIPAGGGGSSSIISSPPSSIMISSPPSSSSSSSSGGGGGGVSDSSSMRPISVSAVQTVLEDALIVLRAIG